MHTRTTNNSKDNRWFDLNHDHGDSGSTIMAETAIIVLPSKEKVTSVYINVIMSQRNLCFTFSNIHINLRAHN